MFLFLKYVLFAVGRGIQKISEIICFVSQGNCFSGGFIPYSQSFLPKKSMFLEDKHSLLSASKISFGTVSDHWHRKCKPLIINVCSTTSNTKISWDCYFCRDVSYQKENESKRKTVECGSLHKGYDLQEEKIFKIQEALQYTNIWNWKKEGKTKCKNDQNSVRESNVGRKVEEEREANFKDLLQVCKNEL